MKIFSREELARYDGKKLPAYIALDGKVFDVSSSFYWGSGRHQVLNKTGLDLSEAMKQAPHGAEMIEKFPIVGVLQQID